MVNEDLINQLKVPPELDFYLERAVPYLIVHRYREEAPTSFTLKLVRNEAAYLIFNVINEEQERFFRKLIRTISDQFGAILILEVSQMHKQHNSDPDFLIHGPVDKLPFHIRELEKALNQIDLQGETPAIEITRERQPDEDLPELLPLDLLKKYEAYHLGLTIYSEHFDSDGNITYPALERDLIGGLAEVFRKIFFSFVKVQTNVKVSHFHELAPKHVDKVAWEVDRELWRINQAFEFLLLISPVNQYEAWDEFRENKYLKAPTFHYRMLPEDPEALKKKLYQIPVEEINDPTLNFIFRDKRLELDKMLTALSCRDSKDFLYNSLQIYGSVENDLYHTAVDLIEQLPMQQNNTPQPQVDSFQFSQMVEEEFQFFKEQDPDFEGNYEISQTVPGLMVSKGKLYVPHDMRISKKRALSLIQHEVGTHILTHFNGNKQPFHLFHSGVPGYEELQEGLAVFSEYLSGGISVNRLRTLAARVIAIYQMLHEEDFPSVCHRLTTEFYFNHQEAFNIAMRVFRGGGFTKDAVYLRGLIDLIDYIAEGKSLQPLLIGKIRQDYLPVVEELRKRQILQPNALTPRYLKFPRWSEKIENIKPETSLIDMVEG